MRSALFAILGLTMLTAATILATHNIEPVLAQSTQISSEELQYAPQGARTCLTCHNSPQIRAVLSSVHGVESNPATPFAQQDCESCHGASPDHYRSMQSPTVVFGKSSGRFPASDVSLQNRACLNCHESGNRQHWAGSEHEFANLSCASCHQIHQEQHPLPQGQASIDLCLSCHREKRAQINLRSHHPLNEGLMTCTSCHNPHGSDAEALLARITANDTCTSCHTEKRGPFLWEHEPVTDNCTNCHNPHGSTQERMLSIRSPFLCQTCHSDAYHPSSLYSGADVPPSGAGQQLLGAGCVNCHSQIHGSNHPSGSRLTR